MQKSEKERLEKIENEVAAIQSDIKTILSMQNDIKAIYDIIETWNNTKGFVVTIRVLSKVAVWIGVTGAALATIYHFLEHFGDK